MKHFSFAMLIFFFILSVKISPSAAKEKKGIIFDSVKGNEINRSVDWKNMNDLSLENACKIAVAGNPSIAAAEARMKQAMERTFQAKSSWWPRIDLSGSASHLSYSDNEYERSLQTARLFDPNIKIDDSEDRYKGSVIAQWIIFNGFKRWYSITSAEYEAKEQKHALIDVKRLLASTVGFSYHNGQLARENIKIAEADELFNQRQLENAEAKYRVGTGSLSDVLNFKVQMNSARSSAISFKQEYEIAMYALAALLGLTNAEFPSGTKLLSLKAETHKDMILPEACSLINYAIKYRPDVLQGELSVKRTKSSVNLARANFFPVFILSGTVDGQREDNSRFERDDFGNSISLNLNYNLFAGGETTAKIREAVQKQKESEKNLEDIKNNAASEVKKSLARLKAAQEELNLQRQNALLVKQRRDIVEKEYQAGQGSLVRLNEAQRDLSAVMGRLALARVGLRQAWHALKISTGTYTVSHSD